MTCEVVAQSLDHLRADQLLTSPLFGLASTRAESVQEDVDRFTALFGKATRTSDEEQQLAELRKRLKGVLQPSETPSGRQIDLLLSSALAATPADPWGPSATAGERVALSPLARKQLMSLGASLARLR